MEWFWVAVGLIILLLAGDWLVKGAVNLALRLGIPALIVSLTIVAFGTSAPELLIAISAVLDGAPGLAVGNVIGSNTANVLLVLGFPAIIAGLNTRGCDTGKSYLAMLGATLIFIAVCFMGPITWMHGIALLALLGLLLWDQARAARSQRVEPDLEGSDDNMRGWQIAMFLGLGLIGLPLGANLLVDNAVVIARDFGVSETVIGLTLIAIGTSLPELATTTMAAIRQQAEVALGNVIGSNMFNLLAIIGITSFFGSIPVAPGLLRLDLWVMLLSSLLLLPFVFWHWRIGRSWGTVFLGLYIAYMAFLLG